MCQSFLSTRRKSGLPGSTFKFDIIWKVIEGFETSLIEKLSHVSTSKLHTILFFGVEADEIICSFITEERF
jgi:hypothetical protein